MFRELCRSLSAPSWRGCALLLAQLVFAVCASPAAVAASGPWPALADTVFRAIPQASDQPSMVLPTVMEQDSGGFLWAGGETGLLRWDGYRFAAYTASRTPSDGLPDHGIADLHRSANGTLWVGTLAGSLARYDPATDHFTRVPLDAGGPVAACICSLTDDGQGGIWAGTSAGLFHLDTAGHQIGQVTHDAAVGDSLPDNHVQAVLRDVHGRLWVGSSTGLAWADLGSGAPHFHELSLPTSDGARAEVSHLLKDGAGRLWIGTRQEGAYVIAAGSTVAVRIADTAGGVAGESPVEIMSMAEVSPGLIWLGTFGRGIVAVDGARLTSHRIVHDPVVPGSLASDSVFSLYADRSGLAWVATTVGLSVHNPGSGGIYTLFARAAAAGWRRVGAPEGISGFDSTALASTPDGGIWVGSEVGGIDVLDGAGRHVANLNLQRVFCLADIGPVMLAGARDGLYRADVATGEVTRITLPGRRPTAGVFALFRPPPDLADDRQGDIVWLGGDDDGAWEFRLDPGGQPVPVRHINAPVLTNPVVHVIAAAPGGKIAVGTENGFNLIDQASGAVERILHDPNDPDSLGTGGVESFAIDRQGRLWAGADTGGINVLVGRGPGGRPRFHHIGVSDGLPNMDIDSMLVDAHGLIWVSTDNGLAVVNPADFSVRALGRADGVAITAYWNHSGIRLPGGTLVFGGTGGLTFVQPDEVGRWSFEPPVHITSLSLAGRPAQGRLAEFPGTQLPVLVVPPTIHAFSAEFAALDFSAPERNLYRYRLLGFDAGWTVADAAHRIAAYTNLSPGDYTLEVQGSNRNGVWTGQTARLAIRVLPAWFQTIWFGVAEALGLGAAVTAVVHARTLVLQRRQRELERMVDARTDELRASERRLHAFAYVDTLTGMPNRRAFNEHMLRLTDDADAHATSFALVLVDLDGFKQVNDSHGHDAGDAVLVEAAARLAQSVREGDFVARLGGDEFSMVLLGTKDMATLESICARVVNNMAVPVVFKKRELIIGASLGAALFPTQGTTPDELYKRADLALYAAKRAGKGIWRWYKDSAA